MSDRKYSKDIANIIIDYLTEEDWKYSFSEEKGFFRMSLKIDGKLQHISYIILVHEDSFTVYAEAPINADANDAEMMAAMAEFIGRINDRSDVIAIANFEMDMNDGQIRCKAYVDCDGIELPKKMVGFAISGVAYRFEKASPGIVGIYYLGMNGKEAYDACVNAS